MASIESAVIRVVVDVSESLADRLSAKGKPEPVDFSVPEAEKLLNDLGAHTEKLLHYLDSPDFAAVAAQYRVRPTLGESAENQVHQGLRLAGLPEKFLRRTSHLVNHVLILACEEVAPQFQRPDGRINHDDVAAAATTTSGVLKRLKSLTRFHTFAGRMCDQVVALHNSIRLPHIGVSRAVRYDQLYVQPGIEPAEQVRLGRPGNRTVILGDPGAGKSTFAAKFAHDIAQDGSGRVPFLMVLREFTGTLDQGGLDLVHYLEMVCKAPYNVKAPPEALDYLMRTGRAVVVLDGLDEVVQTDLRRRVVTLVEGFAHLYPLVPILVTARRIGYEEVPLNSELFTTALILPFTERQVKAYVRQWFVLDDATSSAERKRLIESFIEDSEQIVELRSNPLMLALLCAMYSSDRYLPRNLAQVYERCALMLFEQWDARRGVPLPLKFHGRLRGAVQHLAWKMFTAPESGKAQSRTRIVNTLTQYLEDKLEDHDESMATAEQFLLFCTGRAWILTDVGATDTEPQFGFTHRTFLEYFAAEHLVRTHRTAADLWAVLRPNIGQWEVVAQIVLQLYDRNVEGGADELLGEALADDGLDFAARSLHYMHPSTRTIRAITEGAVHRTVVLPITERTGMGIGEVGLTDEALNACMFQCSPTNLPTVKQTVASSLAPLLERGEPGAIVVLELMMVSSHQPKVSLWAEIHRELSTQHAAAVSITRTAPWGAGFHHDDVDALRHIVQRCGVRSLYMNCRYHNVTRISPGLAHLHTDLETPADASTDLLATAMAGQPTPWASADEFEEADSLMTEMSAHTDSLSLMLSLPLLELRARQRSKIRLSSAYTELAQSRLTPQKHGKVLRWIEELGLPPAVHEFLGSWVRGEISVLAPAPEPQHQPPAPR